MTTIALVYLLLGFLSLVWPLALLLFKRHVLDSQWLMSIAMIMLGLSFITYSSLFNNFLKGEYLLVVLFMVFALTTVPCATLAVASLTKPQGVDNKVKSVFLSAGVMAVLLAASVVVGGADMYRLWIERGAEGMANQFFPGSWRYNIIVFVHFYLFNVILILQITQLVVYTFVRFKRFRNELTEYFPTSKYIVSPGRQLLACTAVLGFCIILSIVLYPLNTYRPEGIVLLLAVPQAIVIAVMGWQNNGIVYSAEELQRGQEPLPMRVRKDLDLLGKEISQFVEKEGGYVDPDLSVPSLAMRFKVSQDQIVDAVHKTHGVTFAEYVDALRVERASALMAVHTDDSDRDFLAEIAHKCGYLDADSLQHAYKRVMRKELRQDN